MGEKSLTNFLRKIVRVDRHCDPSLEIYPTVILQITTIGLLISFSTSITSVMPALMAPAVEAGEVNAAVEVIETNPEPKEVRAEDYMPITETENVQKFIDDYFADIPIMAKVAQCESRYRHYNSQGDVLRGIQNGYDRGVMQINLYYHSQTAEKLGLDVHNINDNVAYARYLYEKQGLKPWRASQACWNKYVGTELALK